MTEILNSALLILAIGIGATLVMDIWALIVIHVFKIPSPGWAMVGRWVGHFHQGVFKHHTILQSPTVPGEKALGWITHYLTGIVYAYVFIYMVGTDWLKNPTLWPALAFGVVTVLVPFLLMQPCFGFGIAASKTPAPWKARLLSLLNHSSFGLGLYLSAIVLALIK